MQIIARLGLSRSPVYKALCELEAQGWAVRQRPAPLEQGDRWTRRKDGEGGAVA